MAKNKSPEIISYVAFLRAINVSGSKVIKMTDLKEMFESAGMTKVKTYIQSGNVRFESSVPDGQKLKRKLEDHLESKLGYRVTVIIRTLAELVAAVALDVFKQYLNDPEIKLYVCYMEEKPKEPLQIPLVAEKEGLHFIKMINEDVYVLSGKVGDHYGFPNPYIEKKCKVLSTSRNWKTICKIVGDK